MHLLRNIDQFGVTYQQEIVKDEKEYKSVMGGMTSLLLYTLSFAYFIYKIFLWLNGDILPRVSSQRSSQSYAEVEFDYDPIMFQIAGMSGNQNIDPFSKTENIITPYFSYIDDIVISQKQSFLDSAVSPAREGISSSVVPQNLTLILNQKGISDQTPKYQRQLMILFERCNRTEFSNCASQEKQDAFFKQPLNTFFITIQMRQFNTKKKEFEMITKQIYFILDEITVLYTQLLFQITESSTDTGFFLESIKKSKYISDFQTTSQQLPQNNFKRVFGNEYLATFLISIDSLGENQLIIYPKLGEILADVGSIMSTLMILKIIVIKINFKMQEDNLLITIISYYYPEFKQIRIEKNILGQINNVEKNGKTIDDKTQFIKFYDQLKDLTKEKLTLTNILYEISRLQFIVQSMQSKQELRQSHQVGIKLKFFDEHVSPQKVPIKSVEKSQDEKIEICPLQPKKPQETLEPQKQAEILQDEDYTLFSKINHLKKWPYDIEQQVVGFYQANKVLH
ncbi:unnamed protein product (macronuclear) [Paramecium tetraurelia]|uniref:Transmembrane protein n=1 Tax=Paramecium tetraurelia TaxID=5888 RepID=A0CD69_PARTE|nr:uncharacterized protein GSPATT00006947001 [Paramecium tetraurelia]CAK68736.1 unnamed protein product [Paramecium tetraurelia]|eukprot:XP_001436133.1 hypothetical protein (macronuclear) [Paramecium tetraurelia strain d4-2]